MHTWCVFIHMQIKMTTSLPHLLATCREGNIAIVCRQIQLNREVGLFDENQ